MKQPAPFSIIVIFAALVLLGISLMPMLNIRLNPSQRLPSINVRYYWSDASAQVLESQVTSPLEAVFGSLKGLKNISSKSDKGGGSINMEFKKGVDLDMARFEISTLIRRTYPDFPSGVSYPYISTQSASNRHRSFMSYTLSGAGAPAIVQQYAEEHIVPQLTRIEGVSDVTVYGATPWEWQVKVKADVMEELGLSYKTVGDAINNYFGSQIIGTGVEQRPLAKGTGAGRYSIILKNAAERNFDPAQIPIAKVDERIIHLDDLATMQLVEQEPTAYYRINGMNTINLVLQSTEGSNEVSLGKEVHEMMRRIRKRLPEGYSVSKSYDSSEYIGKELRENGIRSLLSLVFLLIFVAVTSRKLRYVLIMAISLAANLVMAIILYYFFDIEIHLYSLAGITVSLGIMIDNSIVMLEHYRNTKNRKVFPAILAATLTTLGSLSIIFFLKEDQQLNLLDFAWVMIANLSVSLAVAYWLIPALVDQYALKAPRKSHFYRRRKRRLLRINHTYLKTIRFEKRFRWVFILLLILGFGLPVHRLPQEIEGESVWAKSYNKSLGSDFFTNTMRPILEPALGGSLRLFIENAFHYSFNRSAERTQLYLTGKMPDGCTIQQLNEAIGLMESHIAKYNEVESFTTRISSAQDGRITIRFKPEYEISFPFELKAILTSQAIAIGGLDWGIYGVGKGFSNALGSGSKSDQIELRGYNYNELYRYANLLKQELSKSRRVNKLDILGQVSFWGDNTPSQEYYLHFDPEKLERHDVNLHAYFKHLQEKAYATELNPIFDGAEIRNVRLCSDQAEQFNAWKLNNTPIASSDSVVQKVAQLGTVERKALGIPIYRSNQEYELSVAWDFLGTPVLAKRVAERELKKIKAILPLGYTAKLPKGFGWDKNDSQQYWLILLVLVIIYFICSILLESLIQPLAIIALIPVSFIGVFLTFYLFELNFDQGGFASFILLSGISVNSGLYIINDYNNMAKRYPKLPKERLFLKAYNHKIGPVWLTVASTVFGLVPFLLGGEQTPFWFAFAAGAIGGLLFSLIAVVLYFPLFMRLGIRFR